MSDVRSNKINVLYSGMNKDLDPTLIPEGVYTHAINSQINSSAGDSPFLTTEPSTTSCINLPYTQIGSINLVNKRHAIFTTDDVHSEIGIFDEKDCSYKTIVNDKCLNFNKSFLIKGVAKQNNDGSETIYWCDNNNNNRVLNLNKVPRTYTFLDDTCSTKVFSNDLDCSELELNALIKIPCVTLKESNINGNLQNGAYQVAITYAIKGQTVSDFYGITNVESIFSHENKGSALDVTLNNLDTEFNEYNLHLISTVNQQTSVYLIGTYSTTQTKVTISSIPNDAIVVPYEDVFLQKVVYNKSENVITSNDYLLWMSSTTKPDLNYQLQANKIISEWVAYAVPIIDKNHDLQSYMRDEIYALAIGWKYTDGTRTNKYPLIGRVAKEKEQAIIANEDTYELFLKNCDKQPTVKYWEAYNTATGTIDLAPLDKCEYKEIGSGQFGYYESLEVYPDNKELYGDLACTPIRLFRFPDDSLVPRVLKNKEGEVTHTIHLGVRLKNISHPEDINGNLLKNIQGYEVFRGNRENNKTVLGKGLLFNMGEYKSQIDKNKKVLYANYPYNDLNPDNFISNKQTKGTILSEEDFEALNSFSDTFYTLHSPSFSFNKPAFGTELKIEGIQHGVVNGNFVNPYGHPKHKLITDVGFLAAMLIGLGEAFFATREPITESFVTEAFNLGISAGTGTAGSLVPPAGVIAAIEAYKAGKALLDSVPNPSGAAYDSLKNTLVSSLTKAVDTSIAIPYSPGRITISQQKTSSLIGNIPKAIRLLNDAYLFAFHFQKGTETALEFIRSFSKSEQYAYQVNSTCSYEDFTITKSGLKRRYIDDISYLYPTMQTFSGRDVNNFNRESAVVLKLNRALSFPKIKDKSRLTMGQANACDSKFFTSKAASYYVAVKQSNKSLYGQIQNITWYDTGYCNYLDAKSFSSTYNSGLILGGDTFINKFSVKRKLQYFNQFAFNENDNFEFDYRKYPNVGFPRYWIDSDPYDLSELVSLDPKLPNNKLNLDCKGKKKTLRDKFKSAFIVRNRSFYLANSGVVEFYVESEINLANRDWEENPESRHYDKLRYSDLYELFRIDRLSFDNKYLYDKSYSKQLIENQGFTQSVNYDPVTENSVLTKFKNRVFWSLPNNKDLVIDNWKIYLANNFYDFPLVNGNLVGAKSLNRTNIAFFFDAAAPHIHQTIDQLQTDEGVKITIGDGGLFSRPPQAIITTDINYGNSSTKHGYTNAQYGVFYPSENQGRVYLLQGTNLNEISKKGMFFWFQNNLKFNLLNDFPNFKHKDNTVKGVGFLTTFDNTNECYYLTKIDFKVKEGYKSTLQYNEEKDYFFIKNTNGTLKRISFGDLFYFDDCSWTISYSPKVYSASEPGGWVSFHDWHPNSIIQTENHFISNKNNKLWKHNETCKSFCNYYDTQYSWDIEYVVHDNIVNTLSSIEYYLECYLYNNDCTTYHHLLDYNFSEGYIYNTEQATGLLKFNLANKNKISEALLYPKINSDSIDITYHKEEQRYRFNQFWDSTNNRAEFNSNHTFLLESEPNNYRYDLNKAYINYNKPLFERKKLRHNWFKIYLSKKVSEGTINFMKFKLSNTRIVNSPR